MARLKTEYKDTLIKKLQEQLGVSNIHMVPKLEKIVINMGVGEAAKDKKILEHAVSDLTKISGQKPLVTKSRKAIAGFKIRDGWPIGAKVTLRGNRMYEFLDRLISVAIPRVRDFRGLNKNAFDGNGNYTMGIKEQIVFPEIDYDKIDKIRGMDITMVTSTSSDDSARALLRAFGLPLKD